MADVKKIEAGDVVQLKSGGPRMTVMSAYDDGTVNLCWFSIDGNYTEELDIPAAILKPVGDL